ncbi:hypothetical protein ACO0OE_001719 [Hanseniaspora uvarum]
MNNAFSEENIDQENLIDSELNESNLMEFDVSGNQESSNDEYEEDDDSQMYIPYGEEFGNINPEEFDLLAEFTDDEEFEERQKKIAKATNFGSRKRKPSKADEGESSDDSDNKSEESDEAEEEEDEFLDAMREANNFKPRKKVNKKDKTKKKKKKYSGYKKLAAKINPELSNLMARANEAYVSMDLKLAEELFSEIIKKDSNQFGAYKTLGDIYQQQNRLNDCCSIWMLGAHLNPNDFEFWKEVAMLSLNLNHVTQALYCFNKVLQLDNTDDESLFERSKLCSITGHVNKAIDGFNKLFIKYPWDTSIITEYVTLLNKTGKQQKAVDIYLDIYKQNIKKREFLTKFRENALDSDEDDDKDEEEDDDDIELEGDFAGIPVKTVEKYRCMPFDWSALNIMVDLMLDMPVSKQNEPRHNIEILKDIARFIECRESQTFWNTINYNSNDVEFDDRREFIEAFRDLPEEEKIYKDYNLPIDIRIRLGVLRLKNKQIDEAKFHFAFLLEEEVVSDFYDLFYVAGKNLADVDQYEDAIEYLNPMLVDNSYVKDVVFYKKIGKCFKMLEKYDSALLCYEKILQFQPDQLDNKLNLAEIYHYVGRNIEYKNLLSEVLEERSKINEVDATRTRAKASNTGTPQDSRSNRNSVDSVSPSFTPNIVVDNSKSNNPLMENTIKVKKRHSTPTHPITKQEREEKIKSNVLEKFSKLSLYKKDSIILWQDTVSDLLNIFTSVRNLFLKRRVGQVEGVISRTRRFDKLLDYKIEKITLLESEQNGSETSPPLIKEEKVDIGDSNEVRGLDFNVWFKLFMEFVVFISRERNKEEGLELLDTAEDINVFYGNEQRTKYMKMIRFAIEDKSSQWDLARNFINIYQFNRKIYHLILLVLQDGSKTSLENVSHKNLQKIVLRTIKTFDSFRFNKKITGSAALINDKMVTYNFQTKTPSPYLYYLFGICFFSSKTYGAALQYFLKIDLILTGEPMLKYMIAVSYLHKAMQRQTTVRNFYMIHAVKYLLQYKALQIKKFGEGSIEHVEAEYNVGKFYQMLSLNTLALKHYWNVLLHKENNKFKPHAAVNLVHLYINSNNFDKADEITEQYLVVE